MPVERCTVVCLSPPVTRPEGYAFPFANNDAPRSLHSLLALGSGLLGLNENFYLPAALRFASCRDADDKTERA